MATEHILINGQLTETLREHLVPGMRAVFVGLNPSLVSVKAGHYYQGQLGRRLWDRLREFGLVPWDEFGTEDDFAIKLGFGFADLVRRPTPRAACLTTVEKVQGAADLLTRLRSLPDRPPIVFVYKEAWYFAGPGLEEVGFRTLRLPGPYAPKQVAVMQMKELAATLG